MGMRKLNIITTILMFVCFLVYVFEGIYLLVTGSSSMIGGAYVRDCALAISVVHVLIGLILSRPAFEAIRRTGMFYMRENAAYWVRRISGILMLLFLLCQKLAGIFNILYMVTLVVHLAASVKPVLIEMGIKNYKRFVMSMRVALAAMGILSAAEYTIYLCYR